MNQLKLVPCVALALCSVGCPQPRAQPSNSMSATAAVDTPPPPASAATAKPAASTSVRALPPVVARFVDAYGAIFEFVGTERQKLSEGWPEAHYTVLQFRALRPGSTRVSYSFTRNRGNASELITRQFAVHVLPARAKRHLVIAHPYYLPVRVGDVLQVPVPDDDPWGKVEDVHWHRPAPEDWFGPFEPAGAACPGPAGRVASTAVQVRQTRCTVALLRSLNTRIERWSRFEAVGLGLLPAWHVEVVEGPHLVVPATVRLEVTKGPRSTSSTTVVAPLPAVPLIIGDEFWVPQNAP